MNTPRPLFLFLAPLIAAIFSLFLFLALSIAAMAGDSKQHQSLDSQLAAILRRQGFTGRIEPQLEKRLGRHLNSKLAEVGRLLWFDTLTGLNDDNACGGCHSPTTGFGDTQSIAIGIENNGLVGPNRAGPRNQRRTPMALNTAFFPTLMWNSRFAALSGDPFDNRNGFLFPAPEGLSLQPPPPARRAGFYPAHGARRGGRFSLPRRQ